MSARSVGRRAVVLGGSMAGLLAARVLSDSYTEVVVVDRDTLHGVTGARRGVPQGRHVHGLLARGQQVLDELFPGFTEEAVASGVPTGDLGELRWYFNGRRLAPGTTGLTCVSAARPVLEDVVRRRVEAIEGVELREQHDILGLVASADRSRVTGVRVQHRVVGSTPQVVEADLVVDATGRGSRTPVWLDELGYDRPAEDRIRIDLSYTTRVFRLCDDAVLGDDLSINPVSSPSHRRGAFLSRIEDGKVAVSLTGVLGDTAPTDDAGWLEWARSLPVPDVYDAVKDAEPVTDAVTHRYPFSQRRHYEGLERLPAGLLVVGDAACSFNPVYGQGMTVAALEALVLREHLQRGEPQPVAFQADVAKVIEMPWQSSAGGDLAFPEVVGPRPLVVRVMNGYMGALQAAATQDGRITRTFMRVAGLVDGPQALVAPRTVLRVLVGAWRARGATGTGPVAAVPAPAPVRQDRRAA